MKIIELTDIQFKNYAKIHSARNFMQTTEYAGTMKNYSRLYLGFINENDNTLMGATLLLERKILKFKVGYVPGCFLIDYDNDNLFKDFINTLKDYLKTKKYVYLTTDNITTYKMFDKNGQVLYFDTNIIKIMDELSFRKNEKVPFRKVVLETEKTPNETYKMFNSNTKRNINLALQRAITIYRDENNNIDTMLNIDSNINKDRIKNILDNFNGNDNKAEIYFAKIDPEKYINNYRFLLKKEDENNGVLYTGDIGYLEDGLLYIEGRKNREVKINGRRIRLEHLEENWKKYFRSNMVCSFDDSKLYLLVEGKISEENVNKLREWIPILEKDIIAREVDKLPRKANGKVNVAFRA